MEKSQIQWTESERLLLEVRKNKYLACTQRKTSANGRGTWEPKAWKAEALKSLGGSSFLVWDLFTLNKERKADRTSPLR